MCLAANQSPIRRMVYRPVIGEEERVSPDEAPVDRIIPPLLGWPFSSVHITSHSPGGQVQ